MTIEIAPGRDGGWLQTYTGRQFWPFSPRASDVFLEDIAHALGNLCRYAGHTEAFYSVAQHSVYVSRVVPEHLAMVGLLHDAAEAYCIDLPSPIKRELGEYREMEEEIQAAVAERFGLRAEQFHWDAVKAADEGVMLTERSQLLKPPSAPWWPSSAEPASLGTITCWPPTIAKKMFLARFYQLSRGEAPTSV